MKSTLRSLAVVGVVLAMSTVSSASLLEIRLDFNDAAPSPGGNWNTLGSPGQLTGLIDYNTGLATGVSIETLGDVNDSTADNEWDNSNAGPAWLDSSKYAAEDYFWMNQSNDRAKFSGLTPGQAYRVEWIASSDSSNHGDAEYTVNGQFFDGSADGIFDFNPDGFVTGDWMVWSSVQADGSGELLLKVNSDAINDDGAGRFSAVQLTEVPEPATMAFLGLGGLGALVRRRVR